MNSIDSNKAIILFDGLCNFCDASVNFIIRHDKKNYFTFAALQSEIGKDLLKKYGLENTKEETVVLIENDSAFTKSTAALKFTKHLNGAYPLLYGFIIVPPFIRNGIYSWFAKNRYRWFGKKESCMIPTQEIRAKFIS